MSAEQLTHDQAKFILDWSLPMLKNEHKTTKRVIEAIPLDKGDYRPDNICKTALELAWHIVASEKRFLGGIAAGGFDFTSMPRPESLKNSAAIATYFDESFAANFEKLEELNGEQLTKMLDFRGMFQWPAVSFIQLTLTHTIHHRGHLSMYLRPMGARVPAIYGESYDTVQARLMKEGKAS